MRARAIAFGLVGLRVLMLFGCGGSDSASDGASGNVAEAKSGLARDESPNVSNDDAITLADDNQAFALAAYGALAKANGEQNLFFSPYSTSSALAMAYAGASGPTATEMATALHFTLPPERLHPAFDSVDLRLNAMASIAPAADGDTAATPFTLHVANSMWSSANETFQQPFLDTLAVNYGAGIYLQDFAKNPGAAEARINQWISDETAQKIPKLLDHAITAETKLVLANAIYFDADWVSPFDKQLTTSGSFTTPSGVVTATMMSDSFTLPALHTDAYDAVEIPYRGTTVMDVVLPKAGTLEAFESTLTGESLRTIVSGLGSPVSVALTLPKFGYQGAPIELTSLLQGLGMNLAFTPAADFTGINQDHLFIAKVLHQAFLRVDEKGTEAAAATAVIFRDGGVSAVQPLVINVDHPFFFTIRDKTTNTILFAGRILDPTK